MPPRKLPADPPEVDYPPVGARSAPAPASEPEAGELARAEARAEAARARAVRLRQRAEAASSDHSDPSNPAESDAPRDVDDASEEASASPPRRRLLRRPGRKALAMAAAVVFICTALSASGFLVWQHHNVVQERQRAAEFSAAARNAIVKMLSIEPGKARDEMQSFADDTTGMFKASVLMSAEQFVKSVEDSKLTSKGAVQAVAVESMTKNSAVVLVAAKSEMTKPDQPKPESRSLRVVVDVQRDGGQLKISRIEMVP